MDIRPEILFIMCIPIIYAMLSLLYLSLLIAQKWTRARQQRQIHDAWVRARISEHLKNNGKSEFDDLVRRHEFIQKLQNSAEYRAMLTQLT